MHQFYKNKKVLVTGGCGFIGSHLAHKLVQLGAHVTILDNLATGSVDNIVEIQDNITFIKESIVDSDACDTAVAGNEIVFHLAAFISVPGSVQDPKACHKTNVDGTFNILHAANKYGIDRVVFSSTSSVYGPREDQCLETDTDLHPVSPYGATKLMGELYCKQFTLLYNLPCVILRYFNVYGPRQNPHSQYAAVVSKFQYHIERNEPITIYGDGSQTRDFIHVNEVVHANLLTGMATEKLVAGQVYNIGTGTSISVLELAQQMKTQYPQYTGATKFEPARDGDVPHTQMSVKKYEELKGKAGN
jgi:nucleoside-diphosphate-sugar epimerase